MSLTPIQEVAKRTAEGGAGLVLAGRAVGLEDHRQLLAEHRQRVRDSHKAMAKAAGMGEVVGDGEADTDMGDIIVTGDITLNSGSGGTSPDELTKVLEVLKGKAVSQTTEEKQQPTASDSGKPSALATAAKWALIAAALGGGPSTAVVMNYLNKPVPVDQTSYVNDGEVVPLDGNK